MTDALDKYSITPTAHAKIPDHSFVSCSLTLTQIQDCHTERTERISGGASSSEGNQGEPVHRRYRTNMMPAHMFSNDRCVRCLNAVIDSMTDRAIQQNDIDHTYTELVTIIHDEMNNNLSYKDYSPGKMRRTKRNKPFWNDNLSELWTAAKEAERCYLQFKGRRDRKRDLRTEFITKRDQFDKALRRAQRDYNASRQIRIQKLRTDDPKSFWQEIGKLGPGASNTSPPSSVQLDNGQVSDDPDIVLDKWRRDFEALYQSTNSSGLVNSEFLDNVTRLSAQWEAEYDSILSQAEANENPPAQQIQQASMLLNRSISLEETQKAIACAKNGKAVGIDNVPNEVLKIPALHTCLHKLFSSCFQHHVIPSEWSKAIIHPILKKGKNPLFPLSHRGISLMSTICKIFSAILNDRLTAYLEMNNILVDEQNGFRKLRSCLDHIYVLTTVIRNRKENGLPTYCCFIDFAKAFDSVHYEFLWHKLLACGVHGNMLNTIKALYRNLESCVRVNGRLTDWFSQVSGVRQGDTLAPTLFAIFINDLALEIRSLGLGIPTQNDENISILMYADDVVLISDSEEGLQNMLDTVHDWSKDWRLSINYDKTNVVHFHKASEARTEYEFHIGDNNIALSETYRYLGLDLNETLDYTHGATVLGKAASRALGSINAKFFSVGGLPHDTYRHMYDGMVAPVMDYASEIWGAKKYDTCDTIQHRAMRMFLGVNKCTPLPAIYGDLQWLSPLVRHQVAVIRFWQRLVHMPPSRLTRRVFEWDFSIGERGRRSWTKDVKTILTRCDLGDLFNRDQWYRQSTDEVVSQVRQRLVALERRQRQQDAETMSRMRLYRALHPEDLSQTPNYITSVALSRRQRSALAKLRTGTLPLALETGRYVGRPVEERVCRTCDLGAVERETHFLFDCPGHDAIREQYLNDIVMNNVESSHTENIRSFFLAGNHELKKLSNYIITAMMNRTR